MHCQTPLFEVTFVSKNHFPNWYPHMATKSLIKCNLFSQCCVGRKKKTWLTMTVGIQFGAKFEICLNLKWPAPKGINPVKIVHGVSY